MNTCGPFSAYTPRGVSASEPVLLTSTRFPFLNGASDPRQAGRRHAFDGAPPDGQVLSCLLQRMKLIMGLRSEAFIRQVQLIANAYLTADTWHLLHVDGHVILYSPENDLPDIIAECRRHLQPPSQQTDLSQDPGRILFGSLSGDFSRQIGLGTLPNRITVGQVSPVMTQRLIQHLIDWARQTMLGSTRAQEADSPIEKSIEFDLYDLLEQTRAIPASPTRPYSPAGRQAAGSPAPAPIHQILPEMVAWLHKHYDDSDLTAQKLADAFRVSVRQVHKLFEQQRDGQTFLQTLKGIRLHQAQALLDNPDCWHLSIADVAERCGFANSVYFGRVFREHFKISPGAYRRSQKESFYQTCAFLLSSRVQRGLTAADEDGTGAQT